MLVAANVGSKLANTKKNARNFVPGIVFSSFFRLGQHSEQYIATYCRECGAR